MPSISVIVPVFNSEETIENCIESILNQSFADFEILLINDGSTDQSGELCKQFALLDFRIKYFEKTNGGLADARNFGIERAEGEYFAFVDSDDFLDENAFEFMLEKAENTNCDIVLCGYFKEGAKAFKNVNYKDTTLTKENLNLHLPELKSKNLIDPVWNKLYRRGFLQKCGIEMPVGEIFEDTYFNLSLLKFNPVIEVCEASFYNYTSHLGSITRRYNQDKLQTIKLRAKLLKEVSDNIDEFCDFYFVKSVFSAFIDMFFTLNNAEIKKIIKSEIKSQEFKNAADNAYYSGLLAKGIIGLSLSSNVTLIYLFCKFAHIIKYSLKVKN